MIKRELDEEIKVQLDNTNINEQRSNYVTALIHYDNYKFDNNLNESFLSQNYFNFYHSVFHNIFRLPKSHNYPADDSNDAQNISTVTDGTVEYVTEEDLSENTKNCDVCYTKLNNSIQSVSTCKYCNIKSHTHCLLNFTNIITHLTPLTTTHSTLPHSNTLGDTTLPHTNTVGDNTLGDNTVGDNGVVQSDSVLEDAADHPVDYEYICKICYNRKNKKKSTVKRVRCVICNNYNGIINSGEVFYHPFCALYCYEQVNKFFTTSLMFNSSTELNTSSVNEFNKFLLSNNENNEKLGLECVVCEESDGILTRCSNENCTQFLHPRCILNTKLKKKRHTIVYKYITLSDSTQGTLGTGGKSSSIVLFKGIFCSNHNSKDNINSVIDKFIHTRPYEFTHFVPHTPEPNSIPLNLQHQYTSDLVTGDRFPDKRKLIEPLASNSVKKIRHTEDTSGDPTGDQVPLNAPTEPNDELKIETTNTNTSLNTNITSNNTTTVTTVNAPIPNIVPNGTIVNNVPNTIVNNVVNGAKGEGVGAEVVDELDMKVQKVLWNKLDIFSGNNPRLEGDLISQMINPQKRESLLPLNSVLFDNIFNVEELNYCFQQQLLHNCSNVISLLKFITVNARNRDKCILPVEEQEDKFVYILFENNINNHVLIYQIVPPEEDTSANLLLNPMNQLTDLCYVDRFNDVYNVHDDIKYIINNSEFSSLNSELCNTELGLRLVKSISINQFESELLKRSILQLTHYNVSLLLVNSGNCVGVNSGSGNGMGTMRLNDVIGLNTINWNKIINFNITNGETPLKYSEYNVVSGNSTADQVPRVDEKVLVNEFKLINTEIHQLNNELLMLKRNLSNNILNDITLNMNQNSLLSLQNTINKYNKNEYNYYLLYSLKKLFSDNNTTVGKLQVRKDVKGLIPKSNSAQPHTGLPTGVQNIYELEDVDLIKRCQICFNVEESNINTLFKCVRCLVYVHKYCYNVYRKSNTEYLCNRCEHEKKQNQITFKKFSILCNLCKRGSGVFIKITDFWFHNLCLILHYYTVQSRNGARYKNNCTNNFTTVNSTTNTIVNSGVKSSVNSTDGPECIVCRLKIGLMLSCGCGIKFHAYCGYFQGFSFTPGDNSLTVCCNKCTCNLDNLLARPCNYLSRDVISDKKRPSRIDPSAIKPVPTLPECAICHSGTCGTFTKSAKCPGCEINCVNCGIILHRHCYPFRLGNTFKCVKCVSGSTNLRCFLCHHSDDILIKHTNHTSYYHIVCYTLYNNKFNTCQRRMELRDKVGNLVTSETRGHCCLCLEREGLTIKCFRKGCLNRFHPNCALKNKLVLDFYTPTDYIALCQEHSLLHNAVGPNLKLLIKMRLQILMLRDLFKDMYHQNAVLCSIIRKRKEIHNFKFPLI
ncbi:PHD-zinc-finger like domain protein [Theileria parva strain Muguga]|uniref:PHD-type domain-containing protein n=1 Tax=Theileria parva TaxID=5875 RepID=Q4N204_THEPA|nr:PHD-zinc-finger like domain protein [Theileria parva strain Muguga]EAN31925.1 PHD-zinc-finger like domain protein [Theileria parva strain Muguga]|eukprot:XP_764208.1 hypothetical protein [Theileria parva strain Muguga]